MPSIYKNILKAIWLVGNSLCKNHRGWWEEWEGAVEYEGGLIDPYINFVLIMKNSRFFIIHRYNMKH